MTPFQISRIANLHHPAKINLIIRFNALSLIVSGLIRRRMCGKDIVDKAPMLTFSIRGSLLNAEYGPGRETWTIFFQGLKLKRIAGTDEVEMEWGEQKVSLPLCLPIPHEQVAVWRAKFRYISEAFTSSIHQHMFCAHVGVMDMFKEMIEIHSEATASTPAVKLKSLIDADTRFHHKLTTLHDQCGYSYDHLGILFHKAYFMTPNEYRNQMKMTMAKDMIANTTQAVKEISWRLGFANVSAFSAMFRRMAGYSPREAISRFRHYSGLS